MAEPPKHHGGGISDVLLSWQKWLQRMKRWERTRAAEQACGSEEQRGALEMLSDLGDSDCRVCPFPRNCDWPDVTSLLGGLSVQQSFLPVFPLGKLLTGTISLIDLHLDAH